MSFQQVVHPIVTLRPYSSLVQGTVLGSPESKVGRALQYQLKADERVHRYRSWASEVAQELANNAPPELKHMYQDIADQWATLARLVEPQSAGGRF